MAQATTNELDSRDRFDAGPVAVGAILPSEGHCLPGDGCDASVADGGARHVGAEVFDGRPSGPEGLDVDAPPFGPSSGIDLPVEALEFLAEVTTKPSRHRGQVREEVRVLDPHALTVRAESGSRNEVVDVGMKVQSLVPGVKHSGNGVREEWHGLKRIFAVIGAL